MKSYFKKLQKIGMTSIELVVVFSIFAALAATVLFSYREFSSNIKLKNLTQDIALQIRQAQNRSVSGLYPSLSNGQTAPPPFWAPSYGLYFSKTEDFKDRFVLFFDRNGEASTAPIYFGNKLLDSNDISSLLDSNDISSCGNGDSECLDVIQITTGEYVDDICIDQFTYGGECQSVEDVHIVFLRPLNRAYISYTEMPENVVVSDVSIYIRSATNVPSVIRVTATGQIIVE